MDLAKTLNWMHLEDMRVCSLLCTMVRIGGNDSKRWNKSDFY
ncbi:U-box domain-containing protein 45-like [Iris pallida]|uniref:U-box domain-containing protein 45-like n=1 Tax=Iris pallida TaxID=29817 RepID=A0AAX6DVU5_IRIPA|nr:U-box domain-containing protein 45-like [Iris pallida]